jgi:tubulin-folding cofactor B
MEAQYVTLDVTHSHMKMRIAELKLSRSLTVEQIKSTLEKKFGSSAANMTLQLKNSTGTVVATMDIEDKTLGSYGPEIGYTIHVLDSGAITDMLDDESKVEKFKISKEEYEKRPDSFLQFKKKMVEQKHPGFMKAQQAKEAADSMFKEEADKIGLGKRCQVIVGKRRGTVQYVGKVKEKGPGYWVGVGLDEPSGDSNGMYNNN